jgi:xanthine/uracil permease
MRKAFSMWDTLMESLQWLVFLLANALALPVIIGQIYRLSPVEVADLMQRTLFVVGLTSFLQGRWGHRLPVADGPAGLWLGIFVILGLSSVQAGASASTTLQALEGAMLVTGAALFWLGISGWTGRILSLFSPLVIGTNLLLLAIQLSGTFLKGMLGIGDRVHPMSVGMALTAFGVFLSVLGLSIWGKGFVKSYAVLIGIAAGWLVFVLLGWHERTNVTAPFRLPTFFAWGLPRWDFGLIVTGVMMALVLLSNVVASVSAVRQVVGFKGEEIQTFNRSSWVGGLSNAVSALFSTVGMVPLSISAGFIQMTGQKRLLPFMIACASLVIVSFFPILTSFLAMLPGPVAYAAMLASFTQMVGIGLRALWSREPDQRRLTIIGVSISLGTGVMFLPPEVFVHMPSILQYVAGNGLMVGTLIALILEQVWRERPESAQ